LAWHENAKRPEVLKSGILAEAQEEDGRQGRSQEQRTTGPASSSKEKKM
jgi:hypothetical protein